MAAAQGQWQRVMWLFGAGQGLRVSYGMEMTAIEREEYEAAWRDARREMGQEACAAAMEAGQRASLQEAVDYALEG